MNSVMRLFIIVKVQSKMEIISLGSNYGYKNYYYSDNWILLNLNESGLILVTILHTLSVLFFKVARIGKVLLIFPFYRCKK